MLLIFHLTKDQKCAGCHYFGLNGHDFTLNHYNNPIRENK